MNHPVSNQEDECLREERRDDKKFLVSFASSSASNLLLLLHNLLDSFFCAVCVSQMILIVYFVDKKFRRHHVCSKAAAIAFTFWILFAQPAVRCNSNLSLNTQYRLHFPSQIHSTTYQRFCNYTQQAVHFSILELLVKCKIAVVTDTQRRSDNDKRLWYYKLC